MTKGYELEVNRHDVADFLPLFGSGLVAGAINALAGGGTIFTFPRSSPLDYLPSRQTPRALSQYCPVRLRRLPLIAAKSPLRFAVFCRSRSSLRSAASREASCC